MLCDRGDRIRVGLQYEALGMSSHYKVYEDMFHSEDLSQD